MMGYICHFEGCRNRATRVETVPLLPFLELPETVDETATVRVFCANHYGEEECPGHVASAHDPKVCGRCGVHVDSLRPDYDE